MSAGMNETVFYQRHAAMQRAIKEHKGATSKVQEEGKNAKESGINPAAYKFAVKLATMQPTEQIAFLNDVATYASFMYVEAASQLGTFDLDKSRKKSHGDYFGEGFNRSCLGGDLDDCGHDPNSDAGKSWREGWDAHQRQLMGQFKPTAKTSTAAAPANVTPIAGAKPSRGRPSKAAKAAAEAAAAQGTDASTDTKPPEDEKGDEGEHFEASEAELAQQQGRPSHDDEDESSTPKPEPEVIAAAGRRRAPPPGQLRV